MNFLVGLTPEQIAAITPEAMKALVSTSISVETPEMKLRNIVDQINAKVDTIAACCCLTNTCSDKSKCQLNRDTTKLKDLVEEFVTIMIKNKEEWWIRYEPLPLKDRGYFRANITIYSRKEIDSMFEHPERLICIPNTLKTDLSSYFWLTHAHNSNETSECGAHPEYLAYSITRSELQNVYTYSKKGSFDKGVSLCGSYEQNGYNESGYCPAYWFLKQIYKLSNIRIIDPVKYSVITEYIKPI